MPKWLMSFSLTIQSTRSLLSALSAIMRREKLFDLPVVSFEDLERLYPPARHYVFVAIVFTQTNKLRTRLYLEAKAKGYAPASYISSSARVLANTELGEHCFICEATIVQPHAKLGDNVVLWSGNYVGHHAIIKNNCFTLAHAVICELAEVGQNCIVGPNATVLENVTVADDCRIDAGALVGKDVRRQAAD